MKLNIKGAKYKVIYKKLEGKHGECDLSKKIIYIDTSKNTQGKMHRVTFWHELTHAYLNEMYIGDLIPIELEEILCETVANMIEDHFNLIACMDYGSD